MYSSGNFLGMTNLMSAMAVIGYERIVSPTHSTKVHRARGFSLPMSALVLNECRAIHWFQSAQFTKVGSMVAGSAGMATVVDSVA